jgi:iron complex outermembrane receptor protein
MKVRPIRWRRLVGLLLPLAIYATTSSPAGAAGNPNESYRFDIEPGEAAYRLNDFSTQSGLQLLFGFESMKGIDITPVHGEMKPFDALDRMIAGTNIRYEFINRRTVTLTLGAPGTPNQNARAKAQARSTRLSDRRAPDSEMEEVTISSTSTFAPRQVGATVLTLNRTEIDAGSFVTPQGVIRTLPQVFGGGPTEDTGQIGFEAPTNAAKGYGVNLRGLGAGSTLVLMNGRRLANGGTKALYTDVSNIPLAAIERMDILPDSSSTYYGADAVAGVVNFVMRDEFVGRQTEAYQGSVTDGGLDENYVSQLIGGRTERSKGFMALEFYSRDSLPTSARDLARSNLTDFGGTNFDVANSNPGNISFGGITWAIPRGQDGSDLSPGDFQPGTTNLQDRYEGADLLPTQQRWSAFTSGRFNATDRLTFFGDALASQRNMRILGGGASGAFQVPSTNPFFVNPAGIQAPVVVSYNFTDDLGPLTVDARVKTLNVTGGMELEFDSEWKISGIAGFASERLRSSGDNLVNIPALAAALSDPNPETAFNPFGDGSHTNSETLNSIRASSFYKSTSGLGSLTLMASGPLATLAGGDAILTLGVDGREQSFEAFSQSTQSALTTSSSNLDRSIRAAFAELKIPLVGLQNRRRGVESFEISLAERYEDYSDFGSTATPRFGISWGVIPSLTMRASYSESFRPPGLADLDEGTNAFGFIMLRDPGAAAGATTVLLWDGNNRDLQEETAHSWTAGFDFRPMSHPGTAIAVTYFNTSFSNRLADPTPVQDLLTNPIYAPLITRTPSADLIDEVCSRAPQGASLLPCRATPVGAVADLRFRNDSRLETKGLDIIARHERSTGLGRLSFGLNGTYILDFSEAKSGSLPLQNLVNTPNYPINLRLRSSVRLDHGGFSFSGYVNYANSYTDTASTPRRHISSWTTVDLHTSYNIEQSAFSGLDGTTFSLGVENLLDEYSPFLNNSIVGLGYDQENGDLLGRMVSFNVRKKW